MRLALLLNGKLAMQNLNTIGLTVVSCFFQPLSCETFAVQTLGERFGAIVSGVNPKAESNKCRFISSCRTACPLCASDISPLTRRSRGSDTLAINAVWIYSDFPCTTNWKGGEPNGLCNQYLQHRLEIPLLWRLFVYRHHNSSSGVKPGSVKVRCTMYAKENEIYLSYISQEHI